MMRKFYDTSSLLLLEDFSEPIIISSISLLELEEIKSSNKKDEELRASARKVLRLIDNKEINCTIIIFNNYMLKQLERSGIEINNDAKILATALHYERTLAPKDMIFLTNDLAQKAIAGLFFDNQYIQSISIKEDKYCGYLDIILTNDELIELYNNLDDNIYNLKTNQYLILRDENNNIIDKMCWTGDHLRPVKYYNFNSKYFGDIKPKSGDVYQALAMDSMVNNKITLVKGPAGSGKTMLSLAYLLHLLDKHKIDKIVIFCNTIATKGAAKLGFYPGDKNSKLLDSQIGNLLASKLGDKIMVEKMIANNDLILLPMSDCRGYDTSGMNAGVYITEAQNMDVQLMKLALQRIGEDSICILDGDPLAQVDDDSFAGKNNGMRRVSSVFRGSDVYGEVELKTIHRSKIANIAQNL